MAWFELLPYRLDSIWLPLLYFCVLVDCGLFQGDESFDCESDSSDIAHQEQIDFPCALLILEA